MSKKTCILAVLILFLPVFLTACLGSAADYPDKAVASKDTELMEGLDKTVSTPGKVNESEETKQNEDLQEMKHWQYGPKKQLESEVNTESEATEVEEDKEILTLRRISTSSSIEDYSKSTSIQILTAEEMDEIMGKLISLGYLAERVVIQQDFHDAVAAFQNEQGINSTGELNDETLILLRNL